MMIVKDKDFLNEYIKIWDDGAEVDAPFITLGIEAILPGFYGDLLDAPPPFPVVKGERILDLGCGWGRVLKPVMDRGGDAVGFDISRNMLDKASEHLTKNGHAPALVNGDGTMLPFKDNTFDAVYSLLVLQHLSKENGRELMKEVARVLKPGGRAFVRFPGRYAPENMLFSFLQFISIHLFRYKDPIRMRFYSVREIKKLSKELFTDYEVTAHEFRPPWNFHTKWTWQYIIVPRSFHPALRKISDRLEKVINTRLGFLKDFGVVLMLRSVK